MIPPIFHPDDPPGPSGRLVRLRRNLPWMLEKYPGNIVEIGAGYGESTKVFLEMAERFDRRVLVIDPWDGHDGVEQHDKDDKDYPYTYERFMENVGENPRLDVCPFASCRAEVCFALEDIGECAFMMLDGDMSHDGMLDDLMAAAENDAGTICVDDYGFRESVRSAVAAFLIQIENYHMEFVVGVHECYLLRE